LILKICGINEYERMKHKIEHKSSIWRIQEKNIMNYNKIVYYEI